MSRESRSEPRQAQRRLPPPPHSAAWPAKSMSQTKMNPISTNVDRPSLASSRPPSRIAKAPKAYLPRSRRGEVAPGGRQRLWSTSLGWPRLFSGGSARQKDCSARLGTRCTRMVRAPNVPRSPPDLPHISTRSPSYLPLCRRLDCQSVHGRAAPAIPRAVAGTGPRLLFTAHALPWRRQHPLSRRTPCEEWGVVCPRQVPRAPPR